MRRRGWASRPCRRGSTKRCKRGADQESHPNGLNLLFSQLFPRFSLEAAGGFEPPNNGFANRRLRPLGYAAVTKGCANYASCPQLSIAQSGLGPERVHSPQTSAIARPSASQAWVISSGALHKGGMRTMVSRIGLVRSPNVRAALQTRAPIRSAAGNRLRSP
jgi:hypothetical protein